MLQFVDDLPYPRYAGAVAAHTAVNVPSAAGALASLAASRDLRTSMGRSARQAARARFDWKVIAGAYTELFVELADRRAAVGKPSPGRTTVPTAHVPVAGGTVPAVVHPLRGDPFEDFAGLPSQLLDDELELSATGVPIPDGSVPLDAMFDGLRGTAHEAEAVLAALSDGGATLGELLSQVSPNRRAFVRNTVMWLAKAGAVDWRTPDPGGASG